VKTFTKDLPLSDGEKLTEILAAVQRLDSRVERLDSSVERLDSRVERLESSVERLDSRLGNLEQKVEERLHDTRPIWEKVITDIAELRAGQQRLTEGQQRLTEGQQRLEEGQEFLRGESREMRTTLRDIFWRLSIFNDTLVTMQADYRDIYDRVREIERHTLSSHTPNTAN
jgi:chromosome segregation ATPase